MTGRLGIDFGTSNTVLALWDAAQSQGVPLRIPEYSATYRQESGEVPIIPSLVHYTEDNRIWIGNQVIQRGLQNSPRTMRWMKRYISHRSPMHVNLNGRAVTPYTAGEDFLNGVLVFTAEEIDLHNEEVGLSVPVEAFEHYENWLASIAEAAGLPRFRLIDEPSAAALGYGAHIQPGNIYLIFDFGGGTMHASVILIEAEASAASGRRCRVLGKAGRDVGGSTIDQWLFQEVLKQHNLFDGDPLIRPLSTELLLACQKVKEDLSVQEEAELALSSPDITLASRFSRGALEDLLDRNDLFTEMNQMIRSAMNASLERGYRDEDIQAVLMVGGSCQIPSIQRSLRQMFGRERILYHHPLDAVARGAAAFIAGVDFYDHIQHDYAIRYINPELGKYEYRVIVHRGTAYPSNGPLCRLTIKSSHNGQQQMGLAIFEMGERRNASTPVMELVFDPSGAARISRLTPHDQEQRSLFWMNEHSPTFLAADPPGKQGEPRFDVEFNVDYNKRLTVTARDLNTGQVCLNEHPVVRLI